MKSLKVSWNQKDLRGINKKMKYRKLEKDLLWFFNLEQKHIKVPRGEYEEAENFFIQDFCVAHNLLKDKEADVNQFWHLYTDKFFCERYGYPHLLFNKGTAHSVYELTADIEVYTRDLLFKNKDVDIVKNYGSEIGLHVYKDISKNILDWRAWKNGFI